MGLLTVLLALWIPAQADLSWDHLFIEVDEALPVVEGLREAGFTILPDTVVHVGQGTASMSILLDNGYIELIWVQDADELARADSVLANRMAAPTPAFGFAVTQPDSEPAPFATRAYTAEWMEPGTSIRFAETRGDEPAVFVVPEYMSFASVMNRQRVTSMLPHANGAELITGIRFVRSSSERSAPFAWLEEAGLLESPAGDGEWLELEIDEGRREGEIDLRPVAPLVVRY